MAARRCSGASCRNGVSVRPALSRKPGLAGRLESDKTGGIKPAPDLRYRHRFPVHIIRHAVWLYHVFSLSQRDVELLLAG